MIGKGEIVVIKPGGIGKIMRKENADKLVEKGEVLKEGDKYSFVKTK